MEKRYANIGMILLSAGILFLVTGVLVTYPLGFSTFLLSNSMEIKIIFYFTVFSFPMIFLSFAFFIRSFFRHDIFFYGLSPVSFIVGFFFWIFLFTFNGTSFSPLR